MLPQVILSWLSILPLPLESLAHVSAPSASLQSRACCLSLVWPAHVLSSSSSPLPRAENGDLVLAMKNRDLCLDCV
jgi:hypothetical protein